MKKKKLWALLLALIFAYTAAVPGYALEGGFPEDPVIEETDPVQQPEEEQPVDELPEEEQPTDEQPGEGSPEDEIPGDDPGVELEPPPPPEDPPIQPGIPEGPSEEEPAAPPLDGEEDPGEIPDAGEIPDEEAPDAVPDEVFPTEEPTAPEDGAEPEDTPGTEPFINVLVPARGQVIINPYGMRVETRYGVSTDQVVNEPQELINFSDFPVQVTAQVTGTFPNLHEAQLASAPPSADGTAKEIFMYAEFQPMPDAWAGAFGDWPNQILVTDWGMGKADVLTLGAFGAETCTGYFRLFGSMTPYPEVMWSEDDIVDVTVAFTFAPAEALDQAGGDPPIEEAPLPVEDLLPPDDFAPAEDPAIDPPVEEDDPADVGFEAEGDPEDSPLADDTPPAPPPEDPAASDGL